MFHKNSSKTCLSLLLIILAISALTGCAARLPIWGDPQTGLILEYRMAEGQVLKYQLKIKQTQDIEIMGQQMKTETAGDIAFTAKSKGMKGSNHQLGITIDSMSINVNSPLGKITPDLSSVEGKSFDMIMSALGKELDLAGAESIKYNLGQAGERDIASNFQAVFPDLAGKPVKVGDTWTSKNNITEKIGSGEIQIDLESINTLEGFETVDGLECAKITAQISGTLEGGGNQGGADLAFMGEIEGNETWHFAYKEGLFVKMITDAFTKGTVSVRGPQEMSIPLGQEMKIEARLIK